LLLQPPVVIPFKVPSTCWMTIRNCTYAAEMEYARLAREAWLIWYKRPGTREPTTTVSSKHSQEKNSNSWKPSNHESRGKLLIMTFEREHQQPTFERF
jgi:hypothetical protein